MFSGNSLLEKLQSLNLPLGDFAVFGSGPLWARGLREPSDIDVIARGGAWKRALEHGKVSFVAEGTERQVAKFFGGDIEIFDTWFPGEWDMDEMIDTAEIIDGIPFVRLEHVLRYKKMWNREKDREDIKRIEAFLRSSAS